MQRGLRGVWACTRSWLEQPKRQRWRSLAPKNGRPWRNLCRNGAHGCAGSGRSTSSGSSAAHDSYDGLFSLGFGRPQTGLLESFGEAGFLRIKVNQPLPRPGSKRSIALHGDLYIAGQVQLTQIGRDLIRWREILSNPTETKTEDSPISMLRDLNARLDDWCRLWVWSGELIESIQA